MSETADPSFIYLDNASTTPLSKEAFLEMHSYLNEWYGNASAAYSLSAMSRRAIAKARNRIADSLGARPNEIVFTSSGTESDNWALIGAFEAFSSKGTHIITTSVEHHAILKTCHYLEQRGAAITYLPVDSGGIIDPVDLENALRDDTILISVMAANNEVGAIQPIAEAARIAKQHGILFHTDAVQAYGHIPLRTDQYPIDLMSASAHKLGGPKGAGFLYIRTGVRIGSFLHGGSQERGRRAGTENTAAIAGFGAAVLSAFSGMDERAENERRLRDYLIEGILSAVPDARILGDRERRLPNNVSVLIPGVQGDSLVRYLDSAGIAVSAGAACSAGETEPSHVLIAMGIGYEDAQSALRLTLSERNTTVELDRTVRVLAEAAGFLKAASKR